MSDLELLNEGLAGEHFGIAAYGAALATGLLDEQTAAVARSFQSDHQFHRAALTKQILARGGKPVTALAADDYAKEYPPLRTVSDIVSYASNSRPAPPGPAPPASPGMKTRRLALLAAQIGGVEAQHWALLLAASGADPVPHPIIETDQQNSATAA